MYTSTFVVSGKESQHILLGFLFVAVTVGIVFRNGLPKTIMILVNCYTYGMYAYR